jgi:hypothetical protein
MTGENRWFDLGWVWSWGVSLTLVFQEDGRGNLGGRLTSTSGANFKVEGVIQDGVGLGKCVSGQGGVYFEAHPQGDQLLFALIEPGPDSQPDFNRVQQLLFTRQTGEPTGSPGRAMSYCLWRTRRLETGFHGGIRLIGPATTQ